ncbi:glycosyltransferase [Brevifollis gellanilyticus]|uniref:Glycosyl transferase family 1 n=1 Tax=Brevifollis gellanilyticus TaxID=748831 RepID=A0A512MCY0_9BACT|nr:glycosyltransferase [Brevifollis gellanilyticus]GEP44587.1 glycosyl transferase family 1 [Brevifollis gellanilyticus]
MDRPRLLIISHTYAATENRKKIQALAAHFDVVCVTSALESHLILGRAASDFDDDGDAATRTYELVRCQRNTPNETRFYYRGLSKVMQSGRLDVILVENEPWSVVCLQARLLKSLHQPHALFGVFTWENVERTGLKGWILDKVYRFAAATTDFFIAGSQRTAAILTSRGMPLEKILVAGQLGVDLASHSPAHGDEREALRGGQGLPEKAFVVGYCGRWVEAKGLHELVSACDGMKAVHLALLGAGPLHPWLEEQARTRPWMHLLGARPHAEVPDFLRCLDVFVLASKPYHKDGENWEEQFGHVLIEAMACQVATVGSSSGAIPEVVGEPEVVFPWGDAGVLKQILVRLQEDAGFLSDIVRRQYQQVLEKHTHEALATHWTAFIRKNLPRS